MNYLWHVPSLFVSFIALASAIEETVNTAAGTVIGSRVQELNVIKFLGIPYAEPPIGELRFKPPVRKARFLGIFNATSYGFACPQLRSPGRADFRANKVNISYSEDCLNLNIFVPVNATIVNPRSVMVWVHGGGYTNGAGSFYDSSILAGNNDVIVVTINYRLGILGFLYTMDDNSVGNFGLRDQCLALQWVKENIEEFGGNTSSITIFGESVGAGSVTQLTMTTSCQGLFHRVIAQSGSALGPWANTPDPIKAATELGEKIGCPTGDTLSLVNCLKRKSTEELLKHQRFVVPITGKLPWTPSYESDFFSFVPKELPVWKNVSVENKMANFDLMIGLNMEEGENFYENSMRQLRARGEVHDEIDGLPDKYIEEALIEVARDTFPGRAETLLPSLRFQYTDWKDVQNKFANSEMMVKLRSDLLFDVSSVQYARWHAHFGGSQVRDISSRGRTYFYRFRPRPSWIPARPWSVGASHFDDIFFVFGSLLRGFINSTVEEKYLSQVMMEYWTNFAKTGNPNEPFKLYIITDWPTYTLGAEEYIELDVNMTLWSTGKHPYATRVAFWDEFIPEQVKLYREETEGKPCGTNTSSLARNFRTQSILYLIISLCGFLNACR